MYVGQSPEITKERIKTFITRLASSQDIQSQIALEAIGKASLGKLAILLHSSDELLRLRAATCMLNMADDKGLNTLRKIAMDETSEYRIEALNAITAAAGRNDAAVIARTLLRDEDFNIRLAAYESLRKSDDIAITQRLIANNFYLEQIARIQGKAIFVSRSGHPRIVLFGAPMYCRDNIFVQSRDGNIAINAPKGQKYVSVIRKLPGRPDIPPIQLKTSYEFADIIQTLCGKAIIEQGSDAQPGLAVSYAQAIALIKEMCDKGAIKGVNPEDFHAGHLPK